MPAGHPAQRARDPATKQPLQTISGSNDHFASCGALILLCFHLGWNHGKFAVVHSVAAAYQTREAADH